MFVVVITELEFCFFVSFRWKPPLQTEGCGLLVWMMLISGKIYHEDLVM